MTSASVHEILVTQLRAVLEGRAVVADVAELGTEQILLLVELDRDDPAGAPRQPLPGGLEPGPGEALELHLLLASRTPLFWIARASRRRSLPGGGFGDWLRVRIQGGRVLRVTAGESGRILRLDVAGARDGRHVSLVLDPLPNACRLLVLDPRGHVEQRFPPPIHTSSSGRGAPGSAYEEPRGDFAERWERLADEAGAGHTATRHPPSQPPALWVCTSSPAVEGEGEILLSPRPCPALAARALAGPLHPLEAARLCGEQVIGAARMREARRVVRQALKTELKHMERLAQRIGGEIAEAGEGALLRRQAEALLAQAGRIPKGAAEIEIPDVSDPGRTLRVSLDPARSFADNVNRLFRRAGKLERSLAARSAKRNQLEQLMAFIAHWLAQSEGPSPSPLGWLPAPEEMARAAAIPLDRGLRGRWEGLIGKLRRAALNADTPLDHSSHASRRAAPTDRERARSTARGRSASLPRREGEATALRGPTETAASRGPAEATSSRGPTETAASRGPTEAAAERAGIHPRRFVLPDGWVVLVGRSNAENDILTHQAARPRDLWFHARGVAGSHVVLQRGGRKDNPSKATLDLAASIAAYYSKARTSRHAPVIHTEKRYVRKPRKAPPGLAVCLREKVLMVEPKLPPGSTEAKPGSEEESP